MGLWIMFRIVTVILTYHRHKPRDLICALAGNRIPVIELVACHRIDVTTRAHLSLQGRIMISN
jgi:hypothetical protein